MIRVPFFLLFSSNKGPQHKKGKRALLGYLLTPAKADNHHEGGSRCSNSRGAFPKGIPFQKNHNTCFGGERYQHSISLSHRQNPEKQGRNGLRQTEPRDASRIMRNNPVTQAVSQQKPSTPKRPWGCRVQA